MTDLQKAVIAIIEYDYDTAFKILSSMAKDGNASAQFYFGYMCFNGFGFVPNEKEATKLCSSAIKIFKEQAENGDKEAISKLGRILADGSQVNNTNFFITRMYGDIARF